LISVPDLAGCLRRVARVAEGLQEPRGVGVAHAAGEEDLSAGDVVDVGGGLAADAAEGFAL
jgi:hypothetical protein